MIKIYPRKVTLEYENTLITAPSGCGKTFLILDFLQTFKKEYKYIDLDDLRGIEHEDLESYDLVILENFNFQIPLPKTVTFITSKKHLILPSFKKVLLKPLDFEEYFSFDKSHQSITHAFNNFLKDGNFPSSLFEDNFFKSNALQKQLRLMPYHATVLYFVLKHIGEKYSYYQIYTLLKKEHKISKDTLYHTIDQLIKDRVIYLVEKYNQSKAPKKIFSYNFGFKSVVTRLKNITHTLENMVFLEIMDHFITYYDHISFYLPDEKKAILVLPFVTEEGIYDKLKKISKKLEIESIEVITISNEFNYLYKEYEMEVKPFWIWAFAE